MLKHLPNAISVTRGLCAIPLLWLTLQGQWEAAFWLAMIAGASDGVDGWLAKRFGWQSRLGAGIDPLADKALLLSALLSLTLSGDLPLWFLLLALARDVCIVLGAFIFNWRYERFTPKPSLLGKLTTAALIALIVVELGLRAFVWPLTGAINVLLYLSSALLVASWVHYWLLWQRLSLEVRQRKTP
jgi:cardiolipin synthase